MPDDPALILWFDEISRADLARVGGKNASLGEMVQRLGTAGIRVPPGFATTADMFRAFLAENDLEAPIAARLARLEAGRADLQATGRAIREAIVAGVWPAPAEAALVAAYRALGERVGTPAPAVAVRSSATAEDLPEASFAGQQETFLDVRGEAALLEAGRRCFASLFTDRAIAYRRMHGFGHLDVALSLGVQQMVRADLGGAGVMFSIDTESGFERVVLITAAWGLGEPVVQGTVEPDEYQVFKPLLDDPALVPVVEKRLGAKACKLVHDDGTGTTRILPTSREERARFVLSDAEILTLAHAAVAIERHYGGPMDIEWARDGRDGPLFVVQARPETVQSRRGAGVLETYRLRDPGRRLLTGLSIGDAAVAGRVCLIENAAGQAGFTDGAILVTPDTDPDWVPAMKRATAIVTDHGGRTSHAAIVSRELGLPAVVGTGRATEVLHEGQEITVSCAEGAEGFVYEGRAGIETRRIEVDQVPATRTKVMLNLANPSAAFRWWRLPADGVGLARMEFVISNLVRVHPMALVDPDRVADPAARAEIARLTRDHDDPQAYFVETLARGLARIAALAHPAPCIVRMSDFKTNEYAGLVGGAAFEPVEENPMLGLRGASRYYAEAYRAGFALECRAIRLLRRRLGFANVVVMIPFCRTPAEADRVLETMAANGLRRGVDGLEVFMMAEIPSNVIEAEAFARRFDGFSIGSNDLTQLVLGIDRDSAALAELFDEREPSVVWMIRRMIERARAAGRKIGFCGQAPSDDPAFARLLVEAGIDAISVAPDSFLEVKRHVAAAEAAMAESGAA